jgi:hypothetical protein
MSKNRQAILFSRVRLYLDDGGMESEFWVSGDPQGYDDIEDAEGLIDFQEFLDGLPGNDCWTIIAEVTSFCEGKGALTPASPVDMERIEKAVDEVDIDAISGWNRLGQHTFSFDYDLDELFGMNGIPSPRMTSLTRTPTKTRIRVWEESHEQDSHPHHHRPVDCRSHYFRLSAMAASIRRKRK